MADPHTFTQKATLDDADEVYTQSSPFGAGTERRTTLLEVWSNYIKPKADAIYAALVHTHTVSQITDAGALAAKDTVGTADIDNGAVTYGKIQDVTATDRLLGRDSTGAGIVEELTAAGGLEFTGAGGIQTSAFTGDVTKTAGGTALTIADDAVTFAKMLDASQGSILVGAQSSGVLGEITLASDLSMAGGVLSTNGAILDGDFTAAEGFMRKTGAGAYEAIKSNLNASVAPTANDDDTSGYAIGSRWVDTSADQEYICLDAGTGAAVWKETTAQAGTDAAAIHDNVAGEIAAITEKLNPVGPDIFILEDTEAANAKKRVTLTNILTSDGASSAIATKISTDTKTTLLDDDFLFYADPDNGSDNLKEGGVTALNFWTNYILPTIMATANILKRNVGATLTAGYVCDSFDAGTIEGGIYIPTPTTGESNIQHLTNGGAFSLSPPGSPASVVIELTNNASAGTVTPSDFDKVSGDSFTATQGDIFLCYITRTETKASLFVEAMQ